MAGKVTDRDLGYKELARTLGGLRKGDPRVFVGIQAEAGSDLVVIAASNEYGTSRIPERSYLRSTIDNGEAEILRDLNQAVGRVLDGGDVDQQLGLIGAKWAGKVQQTMTELSEPPNAPSTIARKGDDNPLIDTGRLRQSITWRIGAKAV